MDSNVVGKPGHVDNSTSEVETGSAVNSLILDYYKKFGRKRDLEQFFSLSTAQSDIRDTSGLFWRKMKNENDSSDSGGRRSDASPQELCRISISCTMPDPSSSQSDDPKTKSESPQTVSPPIIIEEAPADTSRHSDEESVKSDDNHSQKSFDPLLDLSGHKPFSPTSSITSQRKLEWDSLADVGYGNESDRKTSGSSLSTLERLALQQQYSNNDTKTEIGHPTSHSTPVDENDKKKKGRKMTRIVKKDVDFVEVNLPQTSDSNTPQFFNVNLTKHISFNVEKSGAITIDNIQKDINVSPDKDTVRPVVPSLLFDKENQTTLPKTEDKSCSSIEVPQPININAQKIPVMISLNTLKKRIRRKKSRRIRKRLSNRNKCMDNKEKPVREKSGEQLSEAESFEYMPGHIYNQNQMKAMEANEVRADNNNTPGNKSSLESSGGITTDSSKRSKPSLTKDLEKCIEILKATLKRPLDDDEVKKKLIKEIVQKLLKTRYKDDDTSTEFLSGLTFNSKKIGLRSDNTTTSTSDANCTDDSQPRKPKSILRTEKFDPSAVASTSQSAPNLFTAVNNEIIRTNLNKLLSNNESDGSSKGKNSSDSAPPKTSSENLYQQYLEALRREEAYKRHLREKEIFLKQKLGGSDSAIKVPVRQDLIVNRRLKELMKDLTRNNYDDGSGDASKLEGGSLSLRNVDQSNGTSKNQRSHSVFTLSSCQDSSKKCMRKKQLGNRDLDAGSSNNHYCCCPHHSTTKVAYADSSVQVNIKCHGAENVANEMVKQDHCCKCSNDYKPDRSASDKNSPFDKRSQEEDPYDKPEQCPQNKCCKCGKYLKQQEHPKDVPLYCQKCNKCLKKQEPEKLSENIKPLCACKDKRPVLSDDCEVLMCKCTRLTDRGIQFETNDVCQSGSCKSSGDGVKLIRAPRCMINSSLSTSSENSPKRRTFSQFSQTQILIDTGTNDCVNNNLAMAGPEVKTQTIMINVATRWVQTEISFNPTVSDPTLSDINIISKCGGLCHEHCKEMVINPSEHSEKKSCSDVCTSSGSTRLLFKPSDVIFTEEFHDPDLNIDVKVSGAATTDTRSRERQSPTEKTRMMLRSNDNNQMKDRVCQCVGTSRPSIAQQGTCIATECAKSVQCYCSTTTQPISFNKNTGNRSPVNTKSSPRKPCLTKTCSPRSPQRNTYPKNILVKDKKPFVRSFTDTGKLEITANADQTEAYNKISIQLSPRKQIVTTPTPENFSVKAYKNDDLICSPRKSKEIGVQIDNEYTDYKSPPKMECKCVGSDSEMAKETCAACCQVDMTIQDKPNTEVKSNKVKSDEEVKPAEAKPAEVKPDKVAKPAKVAKVDKVVKPVEVKHVEVKPVEVKPDKVVQLDEVEKPDKKVIKDFRRRSMSPSPSPSPREKVNTKKPAKEDKPYKEVAPRDGGFKDYTRMARPKTPPEGGFKDYTRMARLKTPPEGGFKDYTRMARPKTPPDLGDIKSLLRSGPSCPCNEGDCHCNEDDPRPCDDINDPILNMIQDITKRYSKSDIMKMKKKKCFSEIVSVIKYLLDTDSETEPRPNSPRRPLTPDSQKRPTSSSTKSSPERKIKTPSIPKTPDDSKKSSKSSKDNNKPFKPPISSDRGKRIMLQCVSCKHDKGIQQCSKCSSKSTGSSDLPCSTDLPSTSDSTACRIFNKIRKECEKYHLRRAKCSRKCDGSSSTSMNCDDCKVVHHCACRHKCKRSKTVDRYKRKCIAYNLILHTSESMMSEDGGSYVENRPLPSVFVKVPKLREVNNQEHAGNFEKPAGGFEKVARTSPRAPRSRSCPKESELSSNKQQQGATVREFLEKNRPDFVANTTDRQKSIKVIKEVRSKMRANQRSLLSMQLERQPDLTTLNSEQLRQLAQQIGLDIRQKRPSSKFISERDMKKHSEKIYKTLPEVVQKKEEKKKENIKKTNLLMANLFKKNLQKKTLRGAVNISNYSTVVKI